MLIISRWTSKSGKRLILRLTVHPRASKRWHLRDRWGSNSRIHLERPSRVSVLRRLKAEKSLWPHPGTGKRKGLPPLLAPKRVRPSQCGTLRLRNGCGHLLILSLFWQGILFYHSISSFPLLTLFFFFFFLVF